MACYVVAINFYDSFELKHRNQVVHNYNALAGQNSNCWDMWFGSEPNEIHNENRSSHTDDQPSYWLCHQAIHKVWIIHSMSTKIWVGSEMQIGHDCYCPASRTTLVATRFRVAVICPIIQVPHCIRVFFYFVWFVFINHIFQFYYELCTYCNILDIYLS